MQDTNRLSKAARREALRERARRVIASLYHNAAPTFPRIEEIEPFSVDEFDAWLACVGEREITSLNDCADSYGLANRKALLVRGPHENIADYGPLVLYGRGGRTLEPSHLWRQNGLRHGPDFSYLEDRNDQCLFPAQSASAVAYPGRGLRCGHRPTSRTV